METIRIQIHRQTQHSVEIENPSYFKIEESQFVKFYKVFEIGNKLFHDAVLFWDGELYTYRKKQDLDKEIIRDGFIIDAVEYQAALDKVYDDVSQEIDKIINYSEIEDDEDRELTEAEIKEMIGANRADDLNDELKIKEFEKQSFHELSRQ